MNIFILFALALGSLLGLGLAALGLTVVLRFLEPGHREVPAIAPEAR